MQCGLAVAACASSAAAAAASPAREIDATHRSPRPDPGAPAAAARARFRVRAHLRRSWCTLAESAMSLRKMRKPPLDRISSLPERRASWPRFPYSRFLTYGCQNIESEASNIHRQIRQLVYTRSSGSNLSNLKFDPTEEVSHGNTGASR